MKIETLPKNFSFTHRDDSSELYTCECVGDFVEVSWDLRGDQGSTSYSKETICYFLNDGTWTNFKDLTVSQLYTETTLPRNFALACEESGVEYTADRSNLCELKEPLVVVCWINPFTNAINATVYSLEVTLNNINSGLWKVGIIYEA